MDATTRAPLGRERDERDHRLSARRDDDLVARLDAAKQVGSAAAQCAGAISILMRRS
jgi:hypothetical protein